MHIPGNKIPDLLTRLKKNNEQRQPLLNKQFELDGVYAKAQLLEEPEPISKGIPTLKKDFYRPSSEMLSHRFRLAGAWKDALFGIRFLSLSEMENVWSNTYIQEQIRIRKENWEGSPLSYLAENEVSIFGIGRIELDEIYLLWHQGIEPKILAYISNDEEQFDNLADFILFYSQK